MNLNLSTIQLVADNLEMIANLAIIISVIRFFWLNSWRRLTFSCGTISVRRKDVNASNLTNLVSSNFFEGGRLPNEIREEVINITNPPCKVEK